MIRVAWEEMAEVVSLGGGGLHFDYGNGVR